MTLSEELSMTFLHMNVYAVIRFSAMFCIIMSLLIAVGMNFKKEGLALLQLLFPFRVPCPRLPVGLVC